MPVAPADLRIDVRWAVPMTDRELLLEHHSLLFRDGRILALLPTAIAAQRYATTATLQRPHHLVLPGFVNAHSHPPLSPHGDAALLRIGEMLKSGVTCFCERSADPSAAAQLAAGQNVRAVIGLPIAGTPAASTTADGFSDYFNRALRLRDEYRGHALISTVFSVPDVGTLDDVSLQRLATLAAELDAAVMLDMHRDEVDVDTSLQRFGRRPITRVAESGLLTPALNALNMTCVNEADLALAERAGIAVTLSPQASLYSAGLLPPYRALALAVQRLALGSGAEPQLGPDLWGELRLLGLLGAASWDAVYSATRGGAAALNLDLEVGSLEPGKWADCICIDLSGISSSRASTPLDEVVYRGGPRMVTDTWVAGRQLLSGGEPTRLDLSRVTALEENDVNA